MLESFDGPFVVFSTSLARRDESSTGSVKVFDNNYSLTKFNRVLDGISVRTVCISKIVQKNFLVEFIAATPKKDGHVYDLYLCMSFLMFPSNLRNG